MGWSGLEWIKAWVRVDQGMGWSGSRHGLEVDQGMGWRWIKAWVRVDQGMG